MMNGLKSTSSEEWVEMFEENKRELREIVTLAHQKDSEGGYLEFRALQSNSRPVSDSLVHHQCYADKRLAPSSLTLCLSIFVVARDYK